MIICRVKRRNPHVDCTLPGRVAACEAYEPEICYEDHASGQP